MRVLRLRINYMLRIALPTSIRVTIWRGILDKIVIRSCAVRHYIALHGYVAGDTISYPICCLIVIAMPLCRTTRCYILPDAAIS